MSKRHREPAVVAALALVAVCLWALVPTYPNYDAYFHLVWGRELLHGQTPSFTAYAASTQHPLYLALCTLLAICGQVADRLLVLVAVLGHVAFVWAVYRFGTAVWDRRAGLAAALLAGSSFALLLYVARAYVDVLFLAVVFWAAVTEAERPGRRTPFVLLALAGLLRPEAWVLSGLLLLWRLRSDGRRAALAALPLVVVAPLLWMLVDLLVTGDPLFSLHATSALAEDLGRTRGLSGALRDGLTFVAGIAREPVAAAAVIGLVVAWRRREARAAHVLAGLALGGTLTFLLTSAAGLSVLPRYLTVPAVVLCLLAGYLVTRSRALAALAVVAGVAFVIVKSSVFGRLTSELRFIGETRDDMHALLLSPQVTAARRCGPVSWPNYRNIPDTRWYLDAGVDQVVARSNVTVDGGAAITYASKRLIDRYAKAAGARNGRNVPPPGFRPLTRRGGFVAWVRCP